MAQFIIAILMLLTGGILLGDELVTLEKAQVKDNQPIVAEISVKPIRVNLVSQAVIGMSQNQAVNHPTIFFQSSDEGDSLQINMARVLEKNYLTPDKDILRSPAIRAPPIG